MSGFQGDGRKQALLLIAERTALRAGVTLTQIRRHVYSVLLDADAPLGAYDIVKTLDGVGAVAPVTAYRALNCLQELGLIHKIRSTAKYVALTSGPSDLPVAFVVCRECGTTEQIPLDLDPTRLLASAEAHGYGNIDPTIEITGFCQNHQT